MAEHPKDNLVRAVELRAEASPDGSKMVGYFAVFDQWTEIRSSYEGNFLERVAPGAFRNAFAKPAKPRVLYDHGADPTIGNKPLGKPTVLREDAHGAYYEVDLFDSSYVNDLKPALKAGELGASFRFKVVGEESEYPTRATAHNPNRLEERTITDVELYEFGPVTFPAYAGASAGMRSRTDEFVGRFLNDPAFVARFIEEFGPRITAKILGDLPARSPISSADFQVKTEEETADDVADPLEAEEDTDDAADGAETDSDGRRAAWFARAVAGFDTHIRRLEGADQ